MNQPGSLKMLLLIIFIIIIIVMPTHFSSTRSLFLCPPNTFIFLTLCRCLASISICPSLIRLLYLYRMSFFVWISAWGHVFLKEWPVYLFCQGTTISVCVPAVSRVKDTLTRTINRKSRVFLCARQPGPTTKSWDMSCFLTHAAPRLTPPACFSYPPQPSQPSRR